MTSHSVTEYLLGCGVVALVVGALVFTGMSNRPSDAAPEGFSLIAAQFGQIDGVVEGADVRFAGMPVGMVHRVELLDDFNVLVTMAVDPDIEIPTDSAALIETDGLFGAKYIELQPGGEFDTVSSGGRLTFTQDSVIIEELVAKIIDQAKAQRGLTETP